MVNYAAGAQGAISGASTGFAIGGPVGGVIGGVAGGAAGLFGSKKNKRKKLSTLDKRQKALNEQQHQSILGEGPLADLYNYDPEAANEVFNKIQARPAQRNFAEQTVPTITGAFRKQGLENSSYVGDSLSRAGRDVQENLDALRSQYLYNEQNQARNAKREAVENLQNRTTFDYDQNASGGMGIDAILKSISPELKQGLQGYFNKTPAAPATPAPVGVP